MSSGSESSNSAFLLWQFKNMGWKTCTWKLCLSHTLKSWEMALDRFFPGFQGGGGDVEIPQCKRTSKSSNHRIFWAEGDPWGSFSPNPGPAQTPQQADVVWGVVAEQNFTPCKKSLLPVWLKSWCLAETRRFSSELAAHFYISPAVAKMILFSDGKVQIDSLRRKSRQSCMFWKRGL